MLQPFIVMAGLVLAIHAREQLRHNDVDARLTPGMTGMILLR
ncbi:hypothetical protein [Microvirga sp. TS319]